MLIDFVITFHRNKYLIFLHYLQDTEQNGNGEHNLSQEPDDEPPAAVAERVCLIDI
jgi:hypothetical protein